MARRDRIAIVLVLSALAGVLLALALPAHAADVVPSSPTHTSVGWLAVLLGGGLCGACSGYLLSGRVRTRRAAVVFAVVAGLGILAAFSGTAFAQESAAPAPSAQVPAFTAWLLSPLGRTLCAALVMAALEALKQWRAFADAALSHPLARAAMALVLAVVAAVPVWATGASLTEALTMVLSSWLGAMGVNGLVGAATAKPPPQTAP